MRNGFRWMAIGLTAGLTAAVLLTGCAREASVEATTVQEPPAATEAAEPDIIIRSDPETKKEDTQNLPAFYLPEERTEENGMISDRPDGGNRQGKPPARGCDDEQ